MGQSRKSVLLDNERYGRVLVVEIEILMPKMTLRLFKTEVNMFLLLPLLPPCPSYDHHLQTEISSGLKVSPPHRSQYSPRLCSAFAGIHASKQF